MNDQIYFFPSQCENQLGLNDAICVHDRKHLLSFTPEVRFIHFKLTAGAFGRPGNLSLPLLAVGAPLHTFGSGSPSSRDSASLLVSPSSSVCLFHSPISVNDALRFCVLCVSVACLLPRLHGGEEVMWLRFCLAAPGKLLSIRLDPFSSHMLPLCILFSSRLSTLLFYCVGYSVHTSREIVPQLLFLKFLPLLSQLRVFLGEFFLILRSAQILTLRHSSVY